MPCPHSSGSDGTDDGIDRRDFMKAALAIGGPSALAAAEARAHGDSHSGPSEGTDTPESLPERQFAWNDYVPTNPTTDQSKTPKHHLQLLLGYDDDCEPIDEDRRTVENALQTLERAYEWSNEGLLFTLGYSPAYFDRFKESLPDGTGLRTPEEVIRESDIKQNGPILAEQSDAHLHLASDTVIPLLEAEQFLFGDTDEVNGVRSEASFDAVFTVVDRRTGFIGNPKEKWDEKISSENPVDEDAPVWFGFKSLFRDSQPSEDHVAIEGDHPFADGSTEQVSKLVDSEIRDWYDEFDHEERVNRMFSPEHTSEDTGPHGRDLGATSGTANRRSDGETMTEIADQTGENAEAEGVVGHAQKLARAREDDGTPPLLRRDFPSTEGDRVRTQFISLQRSISDFIKVRKHMALVDPEESEARGPPDPSPGSADESDERAKRVVPQYAADSGVEMDSHGIQGHFKVERRGTYLIPPRRHRALPPANPGSD